MKKLTFTAVFIAVALTLSNCSKEANDAKEATKTGQNGNNPSQNNGSNSGQNNDSNTGQQGDNSGQNGGKIVTNDYEISPDGKILLRWFNNKVTEIDMQSDPNLSKVTSIHNRVFSDYRSLKKVVLPQGLESIGDDAFGGCELLEEVVLPNGLKEIGEYSFGSCALKNITLSNNVSSIGKGAFEYNQLTSITLPNGIVSIGDFTFQGNQLTSVTLPKGVTSIGKRAFRTNQLTAITIHTGVTHIGDDAFSGNLLASVTFEGATPPLMNERSIFDSNTIRAIYVPAGSVETYKKALPDYLKDKVRAKE